MTLPDSIYTYLGSIEALNDLVSGNIFHVETQQNPPKAIFFEEVGDDRLRPFIASPVLSSTRVSFECWALLQQDAEDIGARLYTALVDPDGDGSRVFTGSMGGGVYVQDIRFESSRPLYDDAAKKYGREIDFTFDYRL